MENRYKNILLKIKNSGIAYIFLISLLVLMGFYVKEDKVYTATELRDLYGSGDVKLWPQPHLFQEAVEGFRDIGALPEPEYPADNSYSQEKEELGKLLFFDPRLSSSGQIACANCHNPDLSWADGMRVAVGHDRQLGTRNTPTVLNTAYATSYFWDGRAKTLEEQALGPIENPVEMHSSSKLAVRRIKRIKGYRELFYKAFGSKKVTEESILKAIATFERSLVSPKSRFDNFVLGKNKKLLSDSELRGLHLFRTKANCINCHNSPYFSDNKFHNLGLTYYGRKYEDLGLYNTTKRNEDVGKFKTPTLREVSETKPYMHNGLFPQLENVVMMYNEGMGVERPKAEQKNDPKFPKKSEMIQKLNLSEEEIQDIVNFLKTLHSYKYKMRPPELPK